MIKIESVDELTNAVRFGNPVVVAGYRRESTHKGYLSWILDSDKNPESANELVRKLAICAGIKEIDFDKVRVVQEAKADHGHTKIDLVLDLYKTSPKPVFRIPIELKVESGPSGAHQFPELNSQPSLVMLLGGSSAQDQWITLGLDKCKVLRPTDVVNIFQDEYYRSRPFVQNWIDAVLLEVARDRLAVEVLTKAKQISGDQTQVGRFLFTDLDYASDKHLWYYVYKHLRQSQDEFKAWSIGDASFNPVLSEANYRAVRGAVSIGELPAHFYFEFVYDDLLVKADFPMGMPEEQWNQWRDANPIRSERLGSKVSHTSRKFGQNPAIARLKLNWLEGIPEIASQAKSFMQATEGWLRLLS